MKLSSDLCTTNSDKEDFREICTADNALDTLELLMGYDEVNQVSDMV